MHVEGVIGCLSQETTDYDHWLSLDDMNMPLVLFDRVCMPERFLYGGGRWSTFCPNGYTALCWIMEASELLFIGGATTWI